MISIDDQSEMMRNIKNDESLSAESGMSEEEEGTRPYNVSRILKEDVDQSKEYVKVLKF